MPRQTKQQRIEELEAELDEARRREAQKEARIDELEGRLLTALISLENYRADHIGLLLERNAELEAELEARFPGEEERTAS